MQVSNANWNKILQSVRKEGRNAIEEKLAAARERLEKAEKLAKAAEHAYTVAKKQTQQLNQQKRGRTHGGGRSRRVHVKSRSRTRKNRRY